MSTSFIPPSLEFPVLWGFDLYFPLISRFAFNLQGVEMSDEDQAKLRSLRHKRILYLSNHPSSIEPPVAYQVANLMGSRFHYMASRNVFNWGFGAVGEVIKRVGAFSVLSGGADKDSVKMARQILSSPEGKLVIYPEGMMTGENDNLVTFMPGISQIGFWGLEDAKKKDPNADILLLPAFVKYILVGSRMSLLREIETSLRNVQEKLNIHHGDRDLVRQFLMVGRVILEWGENEFGLDPLSKEKLFPSSSLNDTQIVETPDWEFRIGRVRHAALNRSAELMKVKFANPDEDAISKIRELFTVKDTIEAGFKTMEQAGMTASEFEEAKKYLDMAYTFLIIKPNYITEKPSAERLMEWIYRFESFAFGKTNWRPRRARVLVHDPISLNGYYDRYKTDKRGTVEAVMKDLRSVMDSLVYKGTLLTESLV